MRGSRDAATRSFGGAGHVPTRQFAYNLAGGHQAKGAGDKTRCSHTSLAIHADIHSRFTLRVHRPILMRKDWRFGRIDAKHSESLVFSWERIADAQLFSDFLEQAIMARMGQVF